MSMKNMLYGALVALSIGGGCKGVAGCSGNEEHPPLGDDASFALSSEVGCRVWYDLALKPAVVECTSRGATAPFVCLYSEGYLNACNSPFGRRKLDPALGRRIEDLVKSKRDVDEGIDEAMDRHEGQ